MDNTTKATEFCSFLEYPDTENLAQFDMGIRPGAEGDIITLPDEKALKMKLFDSCEKLVMRMQKRGCFQKPWIVMPVNIVGFHWSFVGLLNCAYLGTDQEKKFSGFFYYDSLGLDQSRLEPMKMLHNKGILNLIVFANLAFGQPRLTNHDIRKLLWDPSKFARIAVPDPDKVLQTDGSNCGLHTCLCMMDVGLMHSRKYQNKADFDEGTYRDELTYFLKQGDFHKIFKDENSRTRVVPHKGKTWGALHSTFFYTMREHLTCLCNRLLTMKTGEDYQPRVPKLKFPKYIKKNFRKLVWDIDETDQPEINRYQSWYNGNSKDLNNLLNCTNPVIRIPEETFLEDEEDDEKSEEQSRPRFTVQQMEAAGMSFEKDQIEQETREGEGGNEKDAEDDETIVEDESQECQQK